MGPVWVRKIAVCLLPQTEVLGLLQAPSCVQLICLPLQRYVSDPARPNVCILIAGCISANASWPAAHCARDPQGLTHVHQAEGVVPINIPLSAWTEMRWSLVVLHDGLLRPQKLSCELLPKRIPHAQPQRHRYSPPIEGSRHPIGQAWAYLANTIFSFHSSIFAE